MTNHQLTNHQLINQTSGKTEYFTPQPIIEAARRTMGAIDLDPASSSLANERVKATDYFSEGALEKWWHGRSWLNHPFHAGWTACTNACSRKSCAKRGHHIYYDIPSNADWINKLMLEFKEDRTTQACCITFAATSEKWFRPLLRYPQCFLVPRTEYLLPDGSKMRGVTKGSVVTYLGPNTDRFAREFGGLGVVKVRYQPATSSSPSQPQ